LTDVAKRYGGWEPIPDPGQGWTPINSSGGSVWTPIPAIGAT
jgi:hypothetical protein